MDFPQGSNSNESRRQIYRNGRAQGSDCDRRPEWQREAGYGIHHRNQSQQHSAVHPRSTGRAACDLGRRNLGSLALRSAAAAGAASHGENGLRTLRELARSYQTISKDLTRVMNRLKALYRGWGIPCAGTQVYAPRYREEWLSKIAQAGVRRRAELLYQQLDGLQGLRREGRLEFLTERRKHKAAKLLRQIACIGPIRAG